ncbi:het-domain-containing protein [Colletotrichum incanum]|uniref:Het-domain-containing protein n=1 Tax=Colletotrichum incanum TaxID=1573173 RepID=A0A167EAF9_COLIC|nr:het-domain-containing protein [Colletotrichum incanum]OHW94384.1 HET-domain-containing protein [Colletotrichum incanum]
MDLYQHDKLNLGRPAIRLFRLEKGRRSQIFCEIFQAYLDDRGCGVPYEALSLTWGSPELTKDIRVNGKRLPVTDNLHQALLHLRQQDRDRILWIDAVCIDQGNLRERGYQVQQMGDIYRKADQWLEEEATKYACSDWHPEDVRWANIWRDMDGQVALGFHSDLEDRQRQGLETLLGHEWFTRAWILQEVASANAARVCCGTKSVSTRYFGLLPGWLTVVPSPHCRAVVDMMPGISRQHSWWAGRRNLFTLLRQFGHSKATEPRDIIYALCGISTDARGPNVLTPDYAMPTRELMRKFTKLLFRCDMTGVPGWRLVSIRDLAMRVEQLNQIAILVHIENKDKTLCMSLINRETKLSMLKAAGAYARLRGSSMLSEVLRRHRIVLRRKDTAEEIFRDSG